MQYYSYQEKIKKVVAFLAKLYANRVIIIVSIVVLALTATAAVAVKGTVFINDDCPPEITYGEQLKYNSYAFLGKVEYQYCEKGSDKWTSEVPTDVGEYSIRSVAYSSFGNPRYGKVQNFEIKAKKLTLAITSDTIVYGEDPVVNADIAYNERIECEFQYEDITASRTGVGIVKDSVDIKDENGNSTLSNYVLEFSADTIINITKRPLNIVVDGASKIYDTTVLTNCDEAAWEFQEGTLAFEDKLAVVKYAEITDAGTIINKLDFEVRNDGKEVTNHYDLKISSGSLTVEKRPINLTTEGGSAVYSGQPFYNEGFKYEKPEDEKYFSEVGHSIVIVGRTEIVNVTDKPISNILDFAVLDSEGKDVTRNYAISQTPAELTVTKRDVTYKTESNEFVYDGQEHTFTDVVVDNIVEGHTSHAQKAETVIDAGTYTNTHDGILIYNDDGEECTKNYNITYQFGTITVNKRPITFQAGSEEWEYDGVTHSYDFISIELNETEGESGLAEGHDSDVHTSGSVTNVFDYEGDAGVPNVVSSYVITDKGGSDVTKNYDVSIKPGTLKINPRDITISAKSNEWVYNGNPRTENGIDSNGIVDGQVVEYQMTAESTITNWGTVANVIADKENVKIYSNDEKTFETTRNYNILAINDGTLTVTKRPITITSRSDTWVYDDKDHSCDNFTITEGTKDTDSGLLTDMGHSVTLKDFATVKYVYDTSEGNNRYTVEAITNGKDGEEGNVTENYFITKEYGKLTVTARPIWIKAGSTEWKYDGFTHSDDSWTWQESSEDKGLIDGHVVVAMVEGEVTNVFDTNRENVIKAWSILGPDEDNKVLASMDNDVYHNNYSVTLHKGTLTITPRAVEIEVTKSEYKHTYDGFIPVIEIAGTDITSVGEKTIVEGFKYQSADTTPINCNGNFGKYDLKVLTDNVKVVSNDVDDDVDYSGNYTFTCNEYLKLVIEKRVLNITVEDGKLEYNGEEQRWGHYRVESGITDQGLLDGHTLTASKWTAITLVTPEDTKDNNTFTPTITDVNGEVTENYAINITPGTFEIYQRSIRLSAGSGTWEYDGLSHSQQTYTIGGSGLVKGHNFDADITYTGEVTNAGDEAENVLTINNPDITDADGNNVTSNYKIEDPVNGILRITKKKIHVITESLTDEENIGNPYSGTGTVSGLNLPEGSYTLNFTTIESAGSKPNKLESIIYNGADVLENNYDVIYNQKGTLTVYRTITLRTNDVREVYDGNWHGDQNYTIVGDKKLDEGDIITLATLKKAGIKANEVITINNEVITKTSKYRFEYEYCGTIQVDLCPIVVTTGSGAFGFDGGDHPVADFDVNDEIIKNSHTFSVVNQTVSKFRDVTEEGVKENNKFEVQIMHDDEPVTDCFDIEYKYGTVTVEKCYFSLKPKYDEVWYNAQPQQPPQEVEKTDILTTLENNGIKFAVTIGTVEDTECIGSPYQDVSYTTEVKHFELLYADGTPVDTKNYEISTEKNENGTFIIKQTAHITVYLGSDVQEYNGTEQYYDFDRCASYYATIGVLKNGDILQCEIYLEEPGEIMKNKIIVGTHIKVMRGEEDVTEQYTITLDFPLDSDVVFRVVKRTLTVTFNNQTVEYDGTKHFYDDYTIEGLLNEQHNLIISPANEDSAWNINENKQFVLTNAGVIYLDDLIFDITDAQNLSVSEYYDLIVNTEEDGQAFFTVKKRAVTVNITPESYQYTGKRQSYKGTFLVNGLLAGHEYVFDYSQLSGTDICVFYDYNLQTEDLKAGDLKVDICDAEGKSVAENYDIQYSVDFANTNRERTIFEITKTTLTLTFSPYAPTYDGTEKTYNSRYCKKTGLLKGHKLDVSAIRLTDVGTITLDAIQRGDYAVRVKDSSGKDVTENYLIEELKGVTEVLVVEPIYITVQTGSTEIVDEGSTYSYDVATTEGLLQGHTMNVVSKTEVKGVGSVPNVLEVEIVDSKGNIHYTATGTSNNYYVTYSYGTITVIENTKDK